MPTIRTTLSESSLEAALEALRAYRKKITEVSADLPGVIAKEAEKRIDAALLPLIASPDADGNVDARSASESEPYHAKAMMTGSQAAFLEYGTGINGMTSPHPLASEAAWKYNSGRYIRPLADGQLGWTYADSSGTHVATHGIEAQMIVYDAAQSIRGDLGEIARKELDER